MLKASNVAGDKEKASDEVHGFNTTQYPGQGADHRLDAAVVQARRLSSSAATSASDVNWLPEEAEGDVHLVKQAADRDSAASWKAWCDGASQNGAGRLHRVTAYKHVQAPTVVTDRRSVFSVHPQRIVEDMEDKYAKLWKASSTAPEAWVPDRSAL
eukprot:8436761-Pyramimonas_sp.AAC.1